MLLTVFVRVSRQRLTISRHCLPPLSSGGQSSGQCAAAFLRGFSGVRLQGAGGPREEDV